MEREDERKRREKQKWQTVNESIVTYTIKTIQIDVGNHPFIGSH